MARNTYQKQIQEPYKIIRDKGQFKLTKNGRTIKKLIAQSEDGADPEAKLQPYHEYECTGVDDEYVIDVDKTEEVEEWLQEEAWVGHKKEGGELDYGWSEEKFHSPEKMKRIDAIKHVGKSVGQEVKEWFGYEKKEGKWIDHTNPNAKWDWFQIGGRWAGTLKLKEGAEGTQGTLSWMHRMQGETYPEGRADQAYKGDIDFGGMRAEAIAKAEEKWAKYEAIIKEHGELPSMDWADEPRDSDAFKKGKEEYWKHPTVKAMDEITPFMEAPNRHFNCTKEEYVEKARLEAVPTYALLHEGEWIEPGEMGWFGMSSQTKASREDYMKKANEIIDALPDDTLITVVDCHI